jgi:hypothetical protein
MTLLSADQVRAELAATPGWELADGQITKTVTHRDFAAALRYVNAVGYLAEQANHHPDTRKPLGRRPHRQRLRARAEPERSLKNRPKISLLVTAGSLTAAFSA